MPKPLYDINNFSLTELKKQVSLKVGFPIWTKPDCEKMSSLIEAETKNYISESTLYRIFLQNNANKPYLHTLDTLSKFCGYKDWSDFLNKNNK